MARAVATAGANPASRTSARGRKARSPARAPWLGVSPVSVAGSATTKPCAASASASQR